MVNPVKAGTVLVDFLGGNCPDGNLIDSVSQQDAGSKCVATPDNSVSFDVTISSGGVTSCAAAGCVGMSDGECTGCTVFQSGCNFPDGDNYVRVLCVAVSPLRTAIESGNSTRISKASK